MVEIQYNENISRSKVIEASGELGATATGSRRAILKCPLAPGLLQRVKLPVKHLPARERGNARISHLAHAKRNFEIAKNPCSIWMIAI